MTNDTQRVATARAQGADAVVLVDTLQPFAVRYKAVAPGKHRSVALLE